MTVRGTDLALREAGARLFSPSHARSCENGMRRPHVMMKKLERMLLAMAMLGLVSVSAFAFEDPGEGGQNRPPKPDKPVVVVGPKGEKPPPNNKDRPRNDNKRGR